MNANICPECGKEVMPYRRFMLEAEPFKRSACGSCGAMLRRNPRVYFLLLVMGIAAGLGESFLMVRLLEAHVSNWINIAVGILFVSALAMLINYMGWRFIGWVHTGGDKKA